MNSASGTLFIVATPIGNLKDITLRAIDTLKAVDLIACEDTRQTGKLLAQHQIRKPLVSLHEHNERPQTERLLERLKAGQSVALVCDGGTPLISDPGWWLVRQAIERGISVTAIPGPSAAIAALTVSGLPSDRFAFEGFLPQKATARRKRLEVMRDESRTVIVYESPHRLVKALGDIRDVLGDVDLAAARELTKMFEEVRRGRVSELIAHFTAHPPRGEFVLVIQRANALTRQPANPT